MRLAPSLGQFHFNHNPTEVQPLKDIFDIFHGRYLCTKTHFGLDQFAYTTEDGLITGKSIPLGGADWAHSTTTVTISNLELAGQAARWTAVEAYNHLYHQQHESNSPFRDFQGFRQLMLIAPDQRCQQEWDDRKGPDFAVESVYDEHNLDDDTEFSIFMARGETLLAAAQTMAKQYGELMARPDLDAGLNELDASMTIAQALGSTSMEHFEVIWHEAVAQPNAKAGAWHAYQSLTAS